MSFVRAIACWLFVLTAEPGLAQQRNTAASGHRFFDLTNIGLTAMESGALLADGIYTQRALTQYPDVFREADPIARPFVMRGWPGQIAGGALFVGADVGLRYWFHRRGHHRAERWLPLVLTAYGAIGAIHGARELRRIDNADAQGRLLR